MEEWLNMPDNRNTAMSQRIREELLKYQGRQPERDRRQAQEDATGAADRWADDVKYHGMDPRDRMIAELTEKLGADNELVERLTGYDAELDKLDARTQEPQYAGAMEKGSAEAYSAILRASRGASDVANKQLKEQRQTNTTLGEIRDQPPIEEVSIGAA